MNGAPIRVIKVGGSLLDYGDFVGAFRQWLVQQPEAMNILIAGGGRLADEIRDADVRFRIGEERSHWLCVDVLGVTAKLLDAILPETEFVETLEDLWALAQSLTTPGAVVFSPCQYLREVDPLGDLEALPHRWSVTTDSIAARIAQVMGAGELVLLKSSDPPQDGMFREPYVDEHFSHLVHSIPSIQCVNLRRRS